MKNLRLTFLCLALAGILTSAFGESEFKSIPDLIPPSDYPKDKIREIRSIAFQKWPMLAEEAPNVAGSFKTIRPIKGFSNRGDLIWEIRIIHLLRTPTGILWINDRTKESIVLGLSK